MKLPNHLRNHFNINTTKSQDKATDHQQIHPAVWASVGGAWGSGRPVILHDSAICTNAGDHVTCLPNGVCHATTNSVATPGCRVHYNNTGAWGSPSCPAPLPAADVAHATALWTDFNANYTGRRN